MVWCAAESAADQKICTASAKQKTEHNKRLSVFYFGNDEPVSFVTLVLQGAGRGGCQGRKAAA